MNVPRGWTMLDGGAAESHSGAEPPAVLAQVCEKRGCKAGDDRKVEAVVQKYHVRGYGEPVITSFIAFQVPGALGGQDAHNAPSITDGSTPPK